MSRISSKISHPVVVEAAGWAEESMVVGEIEGEVVPGAVEGAEAAVEDENWQNQRTP